MNVAATQFSLATSSFEIYLSGCNAQPKCRGCHNPDLWDFNVGQPWYTCLTSIASKLTSVPIIKSLWILGGEPLDNDSSQLVDLVTALRSLTSCPFWLFTRYPIDEIPDSIKLLFDYIKSGRYEPELAVSGYQMYGVTLATSNQTIYVRGKDYGIT